MRQNRLYQADWLLRFYDFDLSEIAFDMDGHLPLAIDPKLGFALRNLHLFPIDVNDAGRADLLRIPGIGPKSADRILEARLRGRLRSLEGLREIGVVTGRAAPFLLVDGRHQGRFSDVLRKHRAAIDQLHLDLSPAPAAVSATPAATDSRAGRAEAPPTRLRGERATGLAARMSNSPAE
jgi:predicted DNA-binding helix-hairpin-helix protein